MTSTSCENVNASMPVDDRFCRIGNGPKPSPLMRVCRRAPCRSQPYTGTLMRTDVRRPETSSGQQRHRHRKPDERTTRAPMLGVRDRETTPAAANAVRHHRKSKNDGRVSAGRSGAVDGSLARTYFDSGGGVDDGGFGRQGQLALNSGPVEENKEITTEPR